MFFFMITTELTLSKAKTDDFAPYQFRLVRPVLNYYCRNTQHRCSFFRVIWLKKFPITRVAAARSCPSLSNFTLETRKALISFKKINLNKTFYTNCNAHVLINKKGHAAGSLFKINYFKKNLIFLIFSRQILSFQHFLMVKTFKNWTYFIKSNPTVLPTRALGLNTKFI